MTEPDGLGLMLKGFGMGTMRAALEEVIAEANAAGWGHRRFLLELCERERQVRDERKLERLLKGSALPEGKSLAALDQAKLPAKVRRALPELLGGGFVERNENLLAFGLPGRGKTHFLCALGRELVLRHRTAVLFTPTFKLVQGLLKAKEELRLEDQLRKLDRFGVIILDDIGYVQHSREEMEVLFTFLAERYERRSLMVSSNLTFSKWDRIFQDPMTAMAAIDRLVHHSTILKFNGASLRSPANKGPAPPKKTPAKGAGGTGGGQGGRSPPLPARASPRNPPPI